jgi:release factor glutamine methyltransferase
VSASPHLEARLLVARGLDVDGAWLLAHADAAVCPDAWRAIDAFVCRRTAGEPIAYLLGEAWFFGRRFETTEAVLVPRPETELVVEAALDDLRTRARGRGTLRACDVGTGSGAIAVTLAAEMERVHVVASDVSRAALAVADRNVRRFSLGARVRLVHGDLAQPLLPLGPFDCIVANLPYVPTGDVPRRPDPVGYEPRVAVDGGADGLALYRRLVRDLEAIAAPGATAFLEAAPGTIGPLAELVCRTLPRAHVEIGEDYAGLERWVSVWVG